MQTLLLDTHRQASASQEGYGNTLRLPMDHVKFPSEEDKEWLFGKMAVSPGRFGE